MKTNRKNHMKIEMKKVGAKKRKSILFGKKKEEGGGQPITSIYLILLLKV